MEGSMRENINYLIDTDIKLTTDAYPFIADCVTEFETILRYFILAIFVIIAAQNLNHHQI